MNRKVLCEDSGVTLEVQYKGTEESRQHVLIGVSTSHQ